MGSASTATSTCSSTPNATSSPPKRKLSSKITSMKFMQRGLLPSGMSSHTSATSNHPRNRLVAKRGARSSTLFHVDWSENHGGDARLGRNTKLRRHFLGPSEENLQ